MDASRFVIDEKPATPGACIRGIAYAYASASRSVRDLAASGSLESDPATLEAFGFSESGTFRQIAFPDPRSVARTAGDASANYARYRSARESGTVTEPSGNGFASRV